jgi:hypothetical protein
MYLDHVGQSRLLLYLTPMVLCLMGFDIPFCKVVKQFVLLNIHWLKNYLIEDTYLVQYVT